MFEAVVVQETDTVLGGPKAKSRVEVCLDGQYSLQYSSPYSSIIIDALPYLILVQSFTER